MNEINTGVSISEIESKKFTSVNTKYAFSIIDGLMKSQSMVDFIAKYDDTKLLLTYSENNADIVDEIIKKSSSDEAILIERLRTGESDKESYLALLPEVAKILNTSVSTLSKRPSDLQMILAQTYTNYWFSDSLTIKKALSQVADLNHETETELKAETKEQSEERFDNSSTLEAAEYELRRQQQESAAHTEIKTALFSRAVLRKQAHDVKYQQSEARVTETAVETERDDTDQLDLVNPYVH